MTMGLDRRELLAGGGGVVALTLGPQAVRAAAPPAVPPAPVARIAVVKDTYFGETLSDPYRWMENDKDPDWLPFLKAQNDRARGRAE
jgi:prolyl oligopeptidase